LKTASRTEHDNSSFRVIAGADVTSSRLINATLRDTRNQGASEPNSDAVFPKTDTSAAIINRRPRG
jgi:hypothetical protein